MPMYNGEPMKEKELDDVIGATALANLMGWTRGNVHARIRTGSIKARKIGTDWFIAPDEVKRLQAEKKLREAP